ncbi:MAG: type II toxin-antitoxin system RelE/ParE family toxin [Candidatus Pacearchaeota archaeon]|nr:type II toxin-antitoxin system RelE/ParE family toxin [Candidatus Pacearchaeota archaeon]
MYSIDFTKTAEKQLDKFQTNLQKRFISVLERIKVRPFHFVKRKEGSSYFIMRVGEYRAILNIKADKNIIYVMEVGHRKNIYD